MVVADLHVHTVESDGTMTLEEVRDAAREADLAAVAITDHDRLCSALNAPVSRIDADGEVRDVASVDGRPGPDGSERRGTGDDNDGTGSDGFGGDGPSSDEPGDRDGRGPGRDLTVIRGIELRVDTGFGAVDLLGYAGRETPALARELDRLGRNREKRGRRIVERVEDRLGVSLDLAVDEHTGRPHVARAIAESDADYGYREAFAELIGDGCPCYVARDLPSVEASASLLAEACRVVSLAHPFRYRDTERALELCSEVGIDAVERYYPYGHAVDEALLDRTIEAEDLLATGGSDAHDDTLGRAGLPAEAYDRLAERLLRP